jgi:polysaccharide biosynthesis/export protein
VSVKTSRSKNSSSIAQGRAPRQRHPAAGGLNEIAFVPGARFYRDGTLVNVDLPEALRRPNSAANIILLPSDSLVVPEYNPVVLVHGAVNSP